MKNLTIDPLHKEFFDCLYNQQSGNQEPMQRFKEKHPKEYALINGMYHKRTLIKKNICCMFDITGEDVYFGELTFDNEHDKSTEENKRKQAIRFLNDMFSMFLFVEEHGEQKGRYHIHFIGVFDYGKGFNDFVNGWHSRQQIRRVKKSRSRITYVSRYICDYVCKQLPRIRRNKKLIELYKTWQKSVMWSNYQFDGMAKECLNDAKIKLVFDL